VTKLARILLACLAIIGAFIGWVCDRETLRGRAGWALMALCIAALVALPGCSTIKAGAEYCLRHPDHCG
jgi:cell division protein FtsW (lipid II flippase)